MDTLTVSIHLSLKWEEQRIQLYRNTFYLQNFYLTKAEQKEIWSPQIGIETLSLGFTTMAGLELGVYQEEGMLHAWASKEMDLATEIRCENSVLGGFINFLFGKQVCTIEVCMIKV